MVTEAALRDGVFYDFIGRKLNADMRDQTTAEFQKRYHVSQNQAKRVSETAQAFMENMCLALNVPVQDLANWKQFLRWAGLLHEIGLDIAHTGYHKHSAYILEYADMPGFSRKEQIILSQLVLGHRGDLKKMVDVVGDDQMLWYAILSLRLAALFCRARLPLELPNQLQFRTDEDKQSVLLRISEAWLDKHPLIASALEYESQQWNKINQPFDVQTL